MGSQSFLKLPVIHVLILSLLAPAIPLVLSASGRAIANGHSRRPNDMAGLFPRGSHSHAQAATGLLGRRVANTSQGMNPVSLCRSYYRRASLTGITLPPVFHVKQVPDCGGGAVILRSDSSGKKERNRSGTPQLMCADPTGRLFRGARDDIIRNRAAVDSCSGSFT
jgi:hypothetical protein